MKAEEQCPIPVGNHRQEAGNRLGIHGLIAGYATLGPSATRNIDRLTIFKDVYHAISETVKKTTVLTTANP